MTLIQAIRDFILAAREPVHLQDLYSHLPDALQHSIRARIYENLGRHFKRVGPGLYVAMEGEATCVVAHGDAWEKMKEIPSGRIDAVITDPPYPWVAHFAEQGTTRRRMDWSFEKREIDVDLGREIYRVLKEGAHSFFFVPAETATTRPHIEKMIRLLEGCGLVFQKRFVWNKMVLGMGYRGRAMYEGILFFSKGAMRQACDLGVPDVISVKAAPPSQRSHPTEKPLGLLEQLIRFSTKISELILDPFAGSGSTGKAALRLGRDSILIEKSVQILESALPVFM